MKFDETTVIKDIIVVLVKKHRFPEQDVPMYCLFLKSSVDSSERELDPEKTLVELMMKDLVINNANKSNQHLGRN